MSDKACVTMTPFQRANLLLRNADWEDALRAYLEIWQNSPNLRQLVELNIARILRSVPLDAFDRELIERTQRLMGPLLNRTNQRCMSSIGSANKVPPSGNSSALFRALTVTLGIEAIYVVNLSRRPDRYIRALREMSRQGLSVRRVDAVDGKYSNEALAAYEAFRRRPVEDRRPSSRHVSDAVMNQYKNQLSPGVFGYILSQGRVLSDAIREGYKRVLVLDDDVFFHTEAVDRLERLATRLPNEIKVLLLGASEYSDRQSDRFEKARLPGCDDLYSPLPGETCGSFAMVYDRSVYGELLEAINEADGTFDNVALGAIYRRYPDQCLVVDPAICIPDVGDSDIRPNSRAQAEHSEKMRWEFVRYAEYTEPLQLTVLVSSSKSLRYVESVGCELPSSIYLRIYYLSDDGLRPVIAGHQLFIRSGDALSINAADGKQLRSTANALRVPQSDIVLSWPDHRALTEDGVLSAFAKAMETHNKSGEDDGEIDGVIYSLYAGVSPVKGRHSIVIPSFRAVEHVWPTIRSALHQDANDFEVIVVNDNPTNDAFEKELRSKVEAWGLELNSETVPDRLVIINHKINRNASAARNTGLLRSTGEFVSFLDDDDHFEPARLSAVEGALSTASLGVGGCYCGYSGNWNGGRDMTRFPEGDLGDRVLSLRYSEHYMCTNTVSFLRSSILRIGGFNETYRRHQDLELMTRFFTQFKISAVREFLVKNRPSPVPETFVADMPGLCRLKHQFLSDMRHEITRRGNDFVSQVVEAHTKDIAKRDKHMPQEMISLIRSFLSSALRSA